MSRILAMSDIHIEFEHPNGPSRPTREWFRLRGMRASEPGHPDSGPWLGEAKAKAPEAAILAGDIAVGPAIIDYADKVSRYLGIPVVALNGNHEYYAGDEICWLEGECAKKAKATDGRVCFLEKESVRLDLPGGGLWICGTTLWTDYRVNGDDGKAAGMDSARNTMSDHRRINLRGNRLTPEMAEGLHKAARAWLGREIARIREAEPGARIVVATHHAPIPEANPPHHFGGPLCPAFASDMRAEILEWQPDAWVFGHTHHSMEAMVGRTRVVSSQRGYPCIENGADAYLPAVFEV